MSASPESAPAAASANRGESAGASASTGGAPGREFSWRRLLWTLTPLSIIGILIAFEVPICPARSVLGIPCPGCGLTRATEAMVVGDFATMLRFHPLAPVLTPMVLFSVARVTLVSAGAIKNRNDPFARLPRWFWVILAVALVGLWATRMAGLFGGLPDPVDPTGGLLYRGVRGAYLLATGQL